MQGLVQLAQGKIILDLGKDIKNQTVDLRVLAEKYGKALQGGRSGNPSHGSDGSGSQIEIVHIEKFRYRVNGLRVAKNSQTGERRKLGCFFFKPQCHMGQVRHGLLQVEFAGKLQIIDTFRAMGGQPVNDDIRAMHRFGPNSLGYGWECIDNILMSY